MARSSNASAVILAVLMVLVIFAGAALVVGFGYLLEYVTNTYGLGWALALFVVGLGTPSATLFYFLIRD